MLPFGFLAVAAFAVIALPVASAVFAVKLIVGVPLVIVWVTHLLPAS